MPLLATISSLAVCFRRLLSLHALLHDGNLLIESRRKCLLNSPIHNPRRAFHLASSLSFHSHLVASYLECIITFTSHLQFFLSFWSNQNKNLPDTFKPLTLSRSFISFISLSFFLSGCDCSQQTACFVIVLPCFLSQSSSAPHFQWS